MVSIFHVVFDVGCGADGVCLKLPYFSEVEKVREDPVWTDEKHGLQPPEKMKISHVRSRLMY